MKKITILVIVVFLGISNLMSQNIRFVNSSGSYGSYTYGYTTIQAAINAAVNGDTVIVDGGTYNVASNQILINKSITVRAKTGLSSKPQITTSYTSYSYCAVAIAANNVVFDGFEVDGTSAFTSFPTNPIGASATSTSIYLVGDYGYGMNGWTVKNCYIHHGREGIRMNSNSNVTIQGNNIGYTIKDVIDCRNGFCFGLTVTQNWLHSELPDPQGGKPAGIGYNCTHTAGADVMISYNYCTACRTFVDISQANDGAAPSNNISIIHNTVDWDITSLPSPVKDISKGMLWAIAWWASPTTNSFNANKFIINDNIFSRTKFYAFSSSTGNFIGQCQLNNNLFSQNYLVDAFYPGPDAPTYTAYVQLPNEWPSVRGSVGWGNYGTGNGFAFNSNVLAAPSYASTGTTASAYYVLQAGSPALYAATDGTNIGANQYQPPVPAAAPTFSPIAGTYNSTQNVTISTSTSGASIRYTTDGSTPSDVIGTIYSGPVSITQNTTLNAIAYKTNMINSSVTSGVYNIKCVSPTFSLSAGTYVNSQSVTLTCSTSGATIRYTTDGSNPSPSLGNIYSSAINIGSSTTLKALAYKSGMTNSDVNSAYYIINIDSDNDGVLDADDAYPNDSTRAFNNYFPATGTGTLAFEDSWPSKGDYDMNDVVVDYQFKNVTNSHNQLVETFATFTLKATGANYHSGFGFQLSTNNIPNTGMQVTGYNMQENYLMINANGTEQNQSLPTLIVFDNAFDVLHYPGNGIGINTTQGLTYVAPVTITLHIVYTPYTYYDQQLDIEHFNPFIIVDKIRGKEVHLPDYAPTSLADVSLLGKYADNSIPSQGRYYKTSNNLPWALNIYSSFSYPTETTEITKAYLHFIDWVLSNGTNYTDWYSNTAAGYRDDSKIYVPSTKK